MSRLRRLVGEELPFLASLPAFLWEFYFLVVPIIVIVGYSLTASTPSGGLSFTARHYLNLLTPTYGVVIANSAYLAAMTGMICLFIAFPIAYYLAIRARRFKNALLVFLILPSWTSFIIQIYSWFYLLQKRGLFSTLLYRSGLTSEHMSFLNSDGAVILGMVYCFLPFMVFPIYTVLEKMDKRLLEASADLGASPWQTFRNIVLPLSMSGIRTGMLLVMIPAFGEFAIPDLMGGFKTGYVGNVIMEKFLIYRFWGSGAAMVVLSMCVPACAIALYFIVRKMRSGDVSNTEEKTV